MKDQLKDILSRHEGRAQAIKAGELARLVGDDERSVRLAIRELISEGLPVASATNHPAGYFLVNSWSEVEDYSAGMKSRLIEDSLRRRVFRVAAERYLAPGYQGKLI